MAPRAEYSRGMNSSNLILTAEKENQSEMDGIEMFRYHKIPYFLNIKMQERNGRKHFEYNITGKRSLEQLLEYRTLDDRLLVNVLNSFDQACKQAHNYMFAENDILLNPEMIFLECESENACYCYLPGFQKDICQQFRELMEYLLQRLDHKNEQAVRLAYCVYQRVSEENTALHTALEGFRARVVETGPDLSIERKFNKNVITTEKISSERSAGPDEELSASHSFADQTSKSAETLPAGTAQSYIRSSSQVMLSDGTQRQVSKEMHKPPAGSSACNFDTMSGRNISDTSAKIFSGQKDHVTEQKIAKQDQETISRKQKKKGKKQEQLPETDICQTDSRKGDASKLKQKETAKKQAGEKLKNLLRKKLYTGAYCNTQEEPVFEEESGEMPVIHPTVCMIEETEGIRNQFIYQGMDRSRDFCCVAGQMILGSNREECDVCIPFPMISRVHARVEINAQGTFLEDMNSTNGTQINGELLKYREKYMLQKGDIISLAGENYSFY